jgi:hypothetical protein
MGDLPEVGLPLVLVVLRIDGQITITLMYNE